MKVGNAIAHEVWRQGTKDFFVLQSEETLRLILELSELGAKRYDTRHEAAAVGMADGYARATGSVGVAVVSRGPGLTNGLTALITASKGGSSVIVFTGDTPVGKEAIGTGTTRIPTGKPANKNLAQGALLDDIGVRQITLRSPKSAISDVTAAFDLARTGVTIVVNVPIDVLEEEAGDAAASVDLPLPAVLKPDTEEIGALAELLESGFVVNRPVIVVGQGAIKSGAVEAIKEIGDRIGALLVTSLKARSLFRGHPYNIGISGTYATPVASELLTEADLAIVFGASLNGHTTFGGSLYKSARIVHIDRDAGALGRYIKAEMAIQSDAKEAAVALLAELDRRGHHAVGYRTPEVAERIANGPTEETFTDASQPGCLDPRTLMKKLDKVIPADRTIVQDSAHNQRFSTFYLSVPDPASFIQPREAGAVGSAAYVALGVAAARPERLTVLCIGDGGFMMTLTDFDTAVRYGLRLLVVVSNNSGFAAEVLWLRDYGLPDQIPYYKNPSLEAVAKALGAEAMTIEKLEDVEKLNGRLSQLRGPMLLDCNVSLEVPFRGESAG